MVAVPTGIKLFNWIGHDVGRQNPVPDAELFSVGFSSVSLRGANRGHARGGALRWQLTDSYFVVAHFHYVLIGGCSYDFRRIYYCSRK